MALELSKPKDFFLGVVKKKASSNLVLIVEHRDRLTVKAGGPYLGKLLLGVDSN